MLKHFRFSQDQQNEAACALTAIRNVSDETHVNASDQFDQAVDTPVPDLYSVLRPQMPELDDVVAVAAAICGTAASAITLIQSGRQLVLNTNTEMPMDVPAQESFCSRTILQDRLLEVEDAREDARFAKSIFVTMEGGIRFYAGVPFSRPDGSRVGALCVFDQRPRVLNELQRKTLSVLARQVTARLQDHEQRLKLEQAVRDAERARRETEASDRRFKAFINCGPFVAYVKDADGRIVFYNEALHKLGHKSVDDVLGKTDAELWDAEAAAQFRKNDLEVLASGKVKVIDEESVAADGTRMYWKSYKFPFTDEQGRMHVGGISLDVSSDRVREDELRHMQEALQFANRLLQELATTDPLTALQNRRAFDLRLDEECRTAQCRAKPLAMLLLDVDHFKRHNDLFGHAAGDEVLRDVAHVLRTVTRKEDAIGRLGGEEFAVLMPNSDEAEAQRLAFRLTRAIHAFPWQHAPVTVSIGVAEFRPSFTAMGLLCAADQAMYAAKNQGRDRIVRASELQLAPA